jgi:hypothetical protein
MSAIHRPQILADVGQPLAPEDPYFIRDEGLSI